MSRYWQRTINARRWRPVRQAVLNRDGWKCTDCGKRGRLEVHHDPPLRDLDLEADPDAAYHLDGLRTVCRSCHFRITAREIEERKRREGPKAPDVEAMDPWRRFVHELEVSKD